MNSVIDLFCGCGGLSKGFEEEGIIISDAFDNWEPAIRTYEFNFPNSCVHSCDLSNDEEAIKIIKKIKPEIIIGSPPCQDYSSAGKRIEADNANLTLSYAKIVCGIKPKIFVMENVAQIRKSKTYLEAKKIFKSSNYGLTEVVLDSSLCGVPQKRKRFICIGILGKEDSALLELINNKLSKKSLTLREYYGDSLGFEYYYRHPRNYNRRAIFSIDEPAPTIRGVNRPIPKGYPGHKNDACKLEDNPHALTTSDRALIQTFPNDYTFKGTKTDVEQMIGNAVPVKLGSFIAKIIKEYLSQKKG